MSDRLDLGAVEYPGVVEERPKVYLGDEAALPPSPLSSPLGSVADGGLAEAGWRVIGTVAGEGPRFV